jgi:hypothetical protein
VAARLAAAGVHVSGLALRRPTLEEAFLAFTGQPSSRTKPRSPGPAARPQRQPSQLT